MKSTFSATHCRGMLNACNQSALELNKSSNLPSQVSIG
ncbi:hypothetical protein AM1_3985 [Acaryochloris marina MBIC11017]|uniref:Uncharacterized protein n=1 Tax=Acaryochloris marina (strain MBIC 11017) TaxID=329726 RepID=B0C9F7_ACAM1|nr:hypothetical protein AM1_3985 [Acaryochloris marina MBIC11017]